MITLIVIVASAVSHIKHIINVVGIRKTATEPVASNIEGRMVWNALDILILHLPEDSGSQPRHTVAASVCNNLDAQRPKNSLHSVLYHLLQLSPTALSGLSNQHICYNQSRCALISHKRTPSRKPGWKNLHL